MQNSVNRVYCGNSWSAIFTTEIGKSIHPSNLHFSRSSVLFIPAVQSFYSSRFFHLMHKLDAIGNLDFEGLDMDPISPRVIQKTALLLGLIDSKQLPLYNLSPCRGGEVLIELKNGNYEAEIYVYENEEPQLLVFNKENCLFDGRYTLKDANDYFFGF